MSRPEKPESRFAGYTILDLIGASHHGTSVYRASKAARPARLKMITADDASFRWRCIDAWCRFSGIDDPNILVAREMITDRQVAFVSDYAPAISLAEYLASGVSVPVNDIVHIVEGIARALDAGASGGLWHLNLKPTNVLLDGNAHGTPRVYVTDFGMARQSWEHISLEVGEILPADLLFIPPECLSIAPHSRSDVYSLGAIAYSLLGGSNEAAALNPGVMLWAYANGLSLTVLNLEAFDDDVASILASATSRIPEERPASGLEFSTRLAEALGLKRDEDATTTAVPVSLVGANGIGDAVPANIRYASLFELFITAAVVTLVSCICTVLVLKLSGLA
jgi:serine/threonine-protein kinase